MNMMTSDFQYTIHLCRTLLDVIIMKFIKQQHNNEIDQNSFEGTHRRSINIQLAVRNVLSLDTN